MIGATYYTVSDSRFFPGVVALLNSLRLTGNQGRLVVLDFGLRPDQRKRLEPHADVVDIPLDLSENPVLAKPFPHRLGASGVVVVIDSDVIVTRSFDDAIREADEGGIIIWPVTAGHRTRFFPGWEQAFGLESAPREQEYLSAGCVVASLDRFPRFLERWWELASLIPSNRTTQRGAAFVDPFWAAEQDALNAMLMTEIPAEAIRRQPEEDAVLEGSLHQVKIVDQQSLSCQFRRHAPLMLHYGGGPKPWEREAWMRVRPNAYVRLMTRSLYGFDAPLRLDPGEVPAWMRPGLLPLALLHVLGVVNLVARTGIRRLPRPLKKLFSLLRTRLGPR